MAKTDNLTDFMTDLANTIRAKKPNLTGPINAQDFSSEIESISGGTQPTLFEPTVTEGLNSVAWSTNSKNGAFAVTTVGRIDQTEVTSPLTITSALDGKTLYITSSAENFNQSDKVITLNYSSVAGFTIEAYTAINSDMKITQNYIQDYMAPYISSPLSTTKVTTGDGSTKMEIPYSMQTLGNRETGEEIYINIDFSAAFRNKYCTLTVFKNGENLGSSAKTLITSNAIWKVANKVYLQALGMSSGIINAVWSKIPSINNIGEPGTIWKFKLEITEN